MTAADSGDALGHGAAGSVAWSFIATPQRSRLLGIIDTVGLRLPWWHPDGHWRFKRARAGCPVVMGRRTYGLIGGALPGRLNIVLTRHAGFAAQDGVVVAGDVASVRQAVCAGGLPGLREAFVIGGSVVLTQFLPGADCLQLTEAGRPFDGHCFFARFTHGRAARRGWHAVQRERHSTDSGVDYDVVAYAHDQAVRKGWKAEFGARQPA